MSRGEVLDQGGAVFNVRAYGATGNGATDDTAAIESAISAIAAAGAGTLYFPQGSYYSGSCNFSIRVPTAVVGVGQWLPKQRGSLVLCGSTTSNLFNVTSDLFTVRDIAFVNKTRSTAGAAIYFDGPDVYSRINAEDFTINGFYDAIDINAAAYWDISKFFITNPVRYGISVRNAHHPDIGDWDIHDGACVGGPQTDTSASPGSSACIAVFSSGGGKIHTIKSNATFTHGIYVSVPVPSSQLQMTQLDIENVTNSAIYMSPGWTFTIITDSYLTPANGYPGIYLHTASQYYIGNNVINAWTEQSVAAIQVVDGSFGTIGPNQINPRYATPTSVRCLSYCVDLSSLGHGSSVGSSTLAMPIAVDSSGTNTFGTFTGPANIQLQANIAGSSKFSSCAGDISDCANFYLDYWGRGSTANGSVGHGINITGGRRGPGGFDSLWFRNAAGNVYAAFVNRGYNPGNMGTFASDHDFVTGGNVDVRQGTNPIYSCTAPGKLPVGALTINRANCGATADTGLRVK